VCSQQRTIATGERHLETCVSHSVISPLLFRIMHDFFPTSSRYTNILGAMETAVSRLIGDAPGRTVENTLSGTTADGAAVEAFEGIGMVASCCCCHRLQTAISHVLSPQVAVVSAVASKAQTCFGHAMTLNAVFRGSPKSTRMLIEEQAGCIDAVTKKPVYAVGCLGVAGIRWTGEVKAAIRLYRILPFAAKLTIGSTPGERSAYVQKVLDAEAAGPSLKYIIAVLSHIGTWMDVLQSRSLPTYPLILRMIDDVRFACDDIANWCDEDNFADMEEVCSLFVAEVESVFDGWERTELLQLAQLLDPRNVDLLDGTNSADAEKLLMWGYTNLLPRLSRPVLAPPRSGGGVAGGEDVEGTASAAGVKRKAGDRDAGAALTGVASASGRKAAGASAFKQSAESAAAVSADAPARRGNFGTMPKGFNSASTKLADFTRQMEFFIMKLDDVDSSTVHPIAFYEGATGMPDIKLMAYAVYSLQATSAAAESNFGQGRRTMTPERAGLQSKRAGRLITAAMRHKIAQVCTTLLP
jgi:hypothetical protein